MPNRHDTSGYRKITQKPLEKPVDRESLEVFYLHHLYQLSTRLTSCKNQLEICQFVIEACINYLDFDRAGILVIEPDGVTMRGTWGTDEHGQLRCEQDLTAPIDENFFQIIDEKEGKGQVIVWEDVDIVEFRDSNQLKDSEDSLHNVGKGWNAAYAFWYDDQPIGWIAADNLLKGRPFTPVQQQIFRMLGDIVGEEIRRHDQLQNINHLNQQLTNKIQTLEQTLEKLDNTEEKLSHSERMATLGNMVAGFTHDLKTPLGICITASSALSEQKNHMEAVFQSGKLTRSKFDEFMQEVDEVGDLLNRNLARSSELINVFKEVAVDQLKDSLREINAGDYIQDIVKSLKSELKRNKSSVNYHIDGQIVFSTNPGALSQVVINLVNNALNHGFIEGVPGQIDIYMSKLENMLCIDIADNGQGISKEHLPLVLNRFFTTREHLGGTGLGLDNVFLLMTEKLNGAVFINSIPQKGSCFSLVLNPLDVNNQ